MKNEIIAIVPAYNEEGKIGKVVAKLWKESVVKQVLVVDDGSRDRTLFEAKENGAVVLQNEKTMGVGFALKRGMKYAIEEGFPIICILAGNDKDNPSEIRGLITPILENEYDFVQGSRYVKGGKYGKMPCYRVITTRYIHPFLFSLLVKKRIKDSTNGFRAFRTSILNDCRIQLDRVWLDKYELEPYLLYKVIKLSYKVEEAPVTKIYPSRELGYTKMKPITGWWSILKPIVVLALGIKR